MITILHLSFDYPDSISPKNTFAIKNLISATPELNHIVISLHRTSKPKNAVIFQQSNVLSIILFALPYGIFLNYSMKKAAKCIKHILEEQNMCFDIIHAHKLTYEGIIAEILSACFGKPYIISIRGDTDLKLLKFKPHYRALYQKIVKKSSRLLLIAPWVLDKINHYLPENTLNDGNITLLPNVVDSSVIKNNGQKENALITAFHFVKHKIKNKNFRRLISAFDIVSESHPEIRLDIAGDGSDKKIVQSIIQKMKHPEKVRLLGHIDNNEIKNLFSNYMGFVLPSHPETFGLVYIEALSAGIPILYARENGIDGYLNDNDIAVRVSYNSIESITKGLLQLIKENKKLHENVAKMNKSNGLSIFSKVSVAERYGKIIQSI